MSIEDSNKKKGEGNKMDLAHKVLLAGVIGAGISTARAVNETAEIDKRLLTPSAISELQKQSGATDSEISALESNLKNLLQDELKRLREKN